MNKQNLKSNNFSDNHSKQSIDHEWLNSSEASDYLKITVPALRNMVYRGQLKSYRLGRRVRFKRNDLLQLFTAN